MSVGRDTRLGVLYLESFGNPSKFARIARQLSQSMPLLTVLASRSDAGARAAASHTAAAATPAVTREGAVRSGGCHRHADVGGTGRHLGGDRAPANAIRSASRRRLQCHRGTLRREVRGVLVQPMAAPGVEVLAGVVQEPVFGPLVVFGLGGVATDVLADRVARLAPLTDVPSLQSPPVPARHCNVFHTWKVNSIVSPGASMAISPRHPHRTDPW
ncbi:MAG TPA: acetate--CoA ligase family protein [Jiangellaceae bacterium]